MSTLRSVLAWALLLPLVAGLGIFLVLAAGLSLGRARNWAVHLAMLVFARAGLALFGVRTEVSGWEHIAHRRARILVLNHSSILDLFLFSLLNPPAPCLVGKAELRWAFPLNIALWGAGMIFLKRGDHARAVASLQRVVDEIRDQSRTAMISPEGTRSVDGHLGPFKHGPFHLSQQASAEILPVVIRGAWALCPPGNIVVQPGTITIEIKPPLPPSTDPPADAQALRNRYLEWLGERDQAAPLA